MNEPKTLSQAINAKMGDAVEHIVGMIALGNDRERVVSEWLENTTLGPALRNNVLADVNDRLASR